MAKKKAETKTTKKTAAKKTATKKKATAKAATKATAKKKTTKTASKKKAAKKEPKKKAEAKKKAASKKKPTKRSRAKAAENVRLKVYWGVFNHAMKRIALYDFNQRKAAEKKKNELNESGKPPHFVMKIKEPIEEK